MYKMYWKGKRILMYKDHHQLRVHWFPETWKLSMNQHLSINFDVR